METIQIYIGEENVEYKLFINHAGKYCIRVFDLDAEEGVFSIQYPNEEMAQIKFQELIQKDKILKTNS